MKSAHAVPSDLKVPDVSLDLCGLNSAAVSSSNAFIRQFIRDFGSDPCYASYLTYRTYSALDRLSSLTSTNQIIENLEGIVRHLVKTSVPDFTFSESECYKTLMPREIQAQLTESIQYIDKIVPITRFRENYQSLSDIPAPLGESKNFYWKSIENRPGVRPMWGKRFIFEGDIVDFEPEPPPIVGSSDFSIALAEVRHFQNFATPEEIEIARFWSAAAGTSTPVGHWNAIACHIIDHYKISAEKALKILFDLNRALYVSGVHCWRAKYKFNYPRPIQFLEGTRTIIKTPNFPSFPSGHSVFSAAAEAAISRNVPSLAEDLLELSREASRSRVIGGIHFSFDCSEGMTLGQIVADSLEAS